MCGSFRCSAIGSRSRSRRPRSSKHRPCSRRMAGGSHTRATKVDRLDVYVQSFPGPGTKSQVSRNGGSHPVWRADGRELFYLGPDGTMMSVPIGAGRSFDAGLPRALFQANVWTLARNQVYAVTKDGQRFLVTVTPQKSSGAAPLTVVLNWTEAIHK